MQKYYQITDAEQVQKIKESLAKRYAFYDRLDEIEKKYGAETSMIFHSLLRGISFSCLWFKDEDRDKIDTNLFKVTWSVRNKSNGEYGHEVRPRKANKKFYAEFMAGLEDFSYLEFCKILFNIDRLPNASIEFSDHYDYFLVSADLDLAIPHVELTASQYAELSE